MSNDRMSVVLATTAEDDGASVARLERMLEPDLAAPAVGQGMADIAAIALLQ